MAHKPLDSWFGNGLKARPASRTRLGVEVLEQRETPALFTVTTDGVTSTSTGPLFEGGLTLQKAIQLSNSTPGLDTINFSLPPIVHPTSGNPMFARRTIIVPPGGLPAITDPVIIDGTPTDNLGITNGKNNYGIGFFHFPFSGKTLASGTPGIVVDVSTVNGQTTSIRNLDVDGGIVPFFWNLNPSVLVILDVASGMPGSGVVVTTRGRAVISGNSKFGNGVADAVFITGNGVDSKNGTATYTTHNAAVGNLPGYVPQTFVSPGDGITIYGGGVNNGTNVGGTNAGENMVIGDNQFMGVRISGPTASFNQIHQTDIENNGADGVFIVDAPDNLVGDPVIALGGNIIGGPDNVHGRSVHGNTRNGVFILSTDANLFAARNRVQGNNIGGLGTQLNGEHGVRIENAPNTLVGGTQANAGNTIGGNASNGIYALNATTTGLVIQQNKIGTSVANQLDGILIEGAPGALIGGTGTARNIVNNNTRIGIEVKATAKNASIINNQISNNTREGILIDGSAGATNHIIGGSAPNSGNLITGNGFSGIMLLLGANNTNIQGNTIQGNTREGIIIDGTSNVLIGGPVAGARNTINNGNRNGVIVTNGSANVTLQNNVIGTVGGGNTEDGVVIDASSTVLLGTAVANGGNSIVANRNGVSVINGASNVTIVNNTISGNSTDGIVISDTPNVIIGGSAVLQRNTVSSNSRAGLRLEGPSTTGTIVKNNVFTKNAAHGVWIDLGASINVIGGKGATDGNVISLNAQNGVRIENGSNNNIVQGNAIGTDLPNKTAVQGNGSTGVYIDSSSFNLIGGTFRDAKNKLDEGNAIANNAGNGVAVIDTLFTGASGNQITGNTIFANGQLGIDLGDDLGLVTLNDDQDFDTGPNGLQNFPEIISAETGSLAGQVTGKFNSTPNTQFRLEFFSDSIANPNGTPPGYGQGRTFLGSVNVTTDNAGNATYNFFALAPPPVGGFATATATNLVTLDTSEMALAVQQTEAKGIISGVKFNDLNGNGVKDASEPGLSGWEIDLDFQNDGTIDAKTTTDASGNYSFTRLTDGTYKLSEVQKVGWQQTFPLDSSLNPRSHVVQITGELPVPNVDFGNFQLLSISGFKFKDDNGNGKQDAGEGPLSGVTINLWLDNVVTKTKKIIATTSTDLSGNFIFQNIGPLTGPLVGKLGPFTFEVTEVVPPGFAQTTPNPPAFTITSGTNVTGLIFGNKGSAVVPPPGGGTGNTTIITGADAGGGPHVRVLNASDNSQVFSFFAYDPNFRGGVRVAKGDVNKDGVKDIITAPGAGGGPHIKVFDGVTGGLIRSFFAYSAGFAGGVYVAAADVNGDGAADIITGAGGSGGPHVKVFDGQSGIELFSFFAYSTSFTGGVRVAGGDVTGDGLADIITAPGAGGGPHVRIFDGQTFGQPGKPAEVRGFMAFDPAFTGGLYVSAGRLNSDTLSDIIVGPGSGGGPEVRAFDGATNNILLDFTAYAPPGGGPPPSLFNGDSQFATGVRVAVADIDGDGLDDITTGLGGFNSPLVKGFKGTDASLLTQFLAYDPTFMGGVFVG